MERLRASPAREGTGRGDRRRRLPSRAGSAADRRRSRLGGPHRPRQQVGDGRRSKDLKYKPPTISINPGDRVVWHQLSTRSSTRRRKGGSFTTGKIKPGKSVAVKFSAKGTYRYHCTIHEEMFGKIVVG